MGDALSLAQAGVTEAPASLTVRAMVRGYDVMLTVRDVSGRDVLAKLGPVLDALDAMKAPSGGNGHATGASNGNGDAKASPQPGNGDGEHVCPIHGVAMSRYEKDGRTWYSHRLWDGHWCKGKVRAAAHG